MAMLAEPRRKKRTLNLRGKNEWSTDQNKFGQKLLEKMGWAPGKGLGMNEDGSVDHIKVRFKDDNGGVGFKDRNDQWTEHETNFNGLLQALHGGDVDTSKLHSETSLEEKSKKQKSRVHYQKFTRGKDISRYSAKDLANIFGKKSLTEAPKVEVLEETTEVEEKNGDSDSNPYKLIVSGSMKDYFSTKTKGNVGSAVLDTSNANKDISDDESCDVVFRGFSGTRPVVEPEPNHPHILYSNYMKFTKGAEQIPSTIEITGDSSDLKGETKNKIVYENAIGEDAEEVSAAQDSKIGMKSKKKKNKKNKDETEKLDSDESKSSTVIDNICDKSELTIKLKTKNGKDGLKDSNGEGKKKKKSKKNAIDLEIITIDHSAPVIDVSINSEISPKNKNKSKSVDSINSQGNTDTSKFSNLPIELIDLCNEDALEQKVSKNKKRKSKTAELDQETVVENVENITINDSSSNRKEKKRKRNEEREAIESNLAVQKLAACEYSKKNHKSRANQESIVIINENDENSCKKKDKKRMRKHPTLELDQQENIVVISDEERSVCSERKKRKTNKL